MSELLAYVSTVGDLVQQLHRGQLQLPGDARHSGPEGLVALLDSTVRGWTGPITIAGPEAVVLDGAVRLASWRFAFTEPASPDGQAPGIARVGVTGLGHGAQPRFGCDEQHGSYQVEVWQLARTVPFLRWERQLRDAGGDVTQIVAEAQVLATRLLRCPVPVIRLSGGAEHDHIRGLANSQIAQR
jgi:hypothetical protein